MLSKASLCLKSATSSSLTSMLLCEGSAKAAMVMEGPNAEHCRRDAVTAAVQVAADAFARGQGVKVTDVDRCDEGLKGALHLSVRCCCAFARIRSVVLWSHT